MKRFIKKLFLSIKYRKKRIKIGKNCNIGISTFFEGSNTIHDESFLDGYIGYGSYIGRESIIIGKIGRFCSISSHVIVTQGIHPTETFVSTHPAFFSQLKQNGETFVNKQKFCEMKYADNKENCVVICNDVWIGTGVTILPGITIGDGAIVGAGAVVTKNVKPYTIVAGVPAKIIKYRFSQDQINLLMKIRWWDKPIEWIKSHANLFEDIAEFIKSNEDNN